MIIPDRICIAETTSTGTIFLFALVPWFRWKTGFRGEWFIEALQIIDQVVDTLVENITVTGGNHQPKSSLDMIVIDKLYIYIYTIIYTKQNETAKLLQSAQAP